ncbi:MAG: SOS response-associated peptidase [Oscillospiraceae bacterium]|nr:SOS response-associated peptidase [Oscillospiraceae bacterium]
MCATYWLGDSIDIEITNVLAELNIRISYDTASEDNIYAETTIKTGDVYPKQLSGVITKLDTEFALRFAYWGFKRDEKNVVYNSRADKVSSSYFWKSAYQNNRGFIVCDGFYENKRNEKGENIKYRFSYPTPEPIYIAAILTDSNVGEANENNYYSLITTTANSSVSPIHHRMPLILNKAQLYDWVTDIKLADNLLTSDMPQLSYLAV